MNDAFMWTAWFSVICALQLFAQLSKLRFEYVSNIRLPLYPWNSNVRVQCVVEFVYLHIIFTTNYLIKTVITCPVNLVTVLTS